MNKSLSISISIAVLIIASAVFYYLVIFLPGVKNQETENERASQQALNDCLSEAQENFELGWNSTCSNGLGNWINVCQGEQGENCTQCILADKESLQLNAQLESNKKDCYQQYR